MAANVTVLAIAQTDPRIHLLGEVAGYNHHEALGRMVRLWGECTDRETHIVSEAVIKGCLGINGVEAILAADLGERAPNGIRVRGTAGRTDWLAQKRKAGSAGGQARVSSAQAKRGSAQAKRSGRQARAKQNASSAQAERKHNSSNSTATLYPQDPDLSSQDPVLSSQVDLAAAPPPPDGDHKRVVDAFDRLYREANSGAKPSWGGRQGKLVKQLLAASTADEVIRRAGNMFSAPPPWPPPPHDLSTLVQHFDKFAQPARASPRGYFAVTGDETYPDGEVEL